MRVLKSAKVVGSVNWSVVDCVLRNLTEETATISCGHQASIPNEFRLMIPSDKSIQHARVTWRKDSQIGMAFTSEREVAPTEHAKVIH
jgi:DNA recombination-dependent growth factor C